MNLDPREVEFQAFRGHGPGGQFRNRHACCIRAIHRPTGLVAVATSERSLTQNMRAALKNLGAKLARIEEDRLLAWKRARRDAKPEASFGSQIRTCRLCGAERGILDHRSGAWIGLDSKGRGDLDVLILAFLRLSLAPSSPAPGTSGEST